MDPTLETDRAAIERRRARQAAIAEVRFHLADLTDEQLFAIRDTVRSFVEPAPGKSR